MTSKITKQLLSMDDMEYSGSKICPIMTRGICTNQETEATYEFEIACKGDECAFWCTKTETYKDTNDKSFSLEVGVCGLLVKDITFIK